MSNRTLGLCCTTTSSPCPCAPRRLSPRCGPKPPACPNTRCRSRRNRASSWRCSSVSRIPAAASPQAKIVGCDLSEAYTAVARRYWTEADVADRIDLRLGSAADTLAALRETSGEEPFDFAFIDADKANYATCFEHCLALVRPGGLIAIADTLWNGAVADSSLDDADTRAIRSLNSALHADERIDLSLVPIADGLTLCRKRP